VSRFHSARQSPDNKQGNGAHDEGDDHDLHAVSLRHWRASAARLDRREKYAA